MTEPMDNEIAVPYTCKFCGINGTTAASKQCIEAWFNALYPLLACNRCADYRAALTRLRDAIERNAVDVLRGRQYAQASQKAKTDLPALESACRDIFTTLTRKLAKLHCDFRNLVLVWEPDFTDQLMRKPHRHQEAINFYLRGIDAIRKASA